ncbi:LysR family transcriptional regulator [Streptomyces sp. NPDC054841]
MGYTRRRCFATVHIEVRHARVVAAIAEAGSISKAASTLQLPQPSLTAQLRRIEGAVGGSLFDRTHAGVTPTVLGKRLLPLLVELVRCRDAVVAEAAMVTQSRTLLRIGNFEWTPSGLRAAIQSALSAYEVRTETVDAAIAVDRVLQGTLAATLTQSPRTPQPAPVPALLGNVAIVSEPVWVALPPGHPLAAQHAITLSQMAGLRWVRHVRGHWFHEIEEQLFGRFDEVRPEVLHRVGGHAEAMSWVRDAGTAAFITPTGATSDVRLVPVEGTVCAEMRLVWRSEEINDVALRGIVRAIRRYYCTYAQSIPRYWEWITTHRGDFTELAEFMPEMNEAISHEPSWDYSHQLQ